LTLFVILVIVYCCLYKFIIINTDPLENNILLFVQGGKSETSLLQNFLEVRGVRGDYRGVRGVRGVRGEYGGYEGSTRKYGKYRSLAFSPCFFPLGITIRCIYPRRQEETSDIV